MATISPVIPHEDTGILKQILATVQSIQQNYSQLAAAIESIQGQVNTLAGAELIRNTTEEPSVMNDEHYTLSPSMSKDHHPRYSRAATSSPPASLNFRQESLPNRDFSPLRKKVGGNSISRIILTTYPHQAGMDPLALNWGHEDPLQRGPVVVSRNQSTIRRRNGVYLNFAPESPLFSQTSHSDRSSWRLIRNLSCFGYCE